MQLAAQNPWGDDRADLRQYINTTNLAYAAGANVKNTNCLHVDGLLKRVSAAGKSTDVNATASSLKLLAGSMPKVHNEH